jgi:uncharacterized damage-inducible protein DinB
MITKPQPDEYAPFYANYITKAGEGDIIETLTRLKDSTWHFFTNLCTGKEDYAYAQGKWTIKQLLNHMIDAERIFAYRVLRFTRKDETVLAGFDENTYVENADISSRTLQDLASEFRALREANLFLFRSVTANQSLYRGTASGAPVSVRALLYIAAGHEIHHIDVLKERYL